MADAPKQPRPRHYPSPVDYEAWGNGYMPPSEHVLIDQLAYRGARVILSCDSGKPDGPAYWLVVRGKTNPKKVGLAIAQMMAGWEDDELAAQAEAAIPAESSAGSPSEASASAPAPDGLQKDPSP